MTVNSLLREAVICRKGFVMKKLTCFLLVLCMVLAGCASSAGSAGESSSVTAMPTTQIPETGFVEVTREGETRQIPVVFVDGTVGSYTIATDPEYFTFTSHETVDMFAYESWQGEQPVYYAISAYSNAYDAEQFVADCLTQFEALYTSCSTETLTVGGYDATLIRFTGYREAAEYCRHIYLLDCGDSRYLIEAEFTMEMYEGLYAIMRALFDTFTVK